MSPWKSYLDFVIKIDPAPEGGFRVEAQGPVGEAEGSFQLPFDEKDIKIFLLEVRQQRRAPQRGRVPEPMQPTLEFGSRLYDAIVSGEVRDLFIASRQAALQNGLGLRLRLKLQNAPILMDLPWEFLYDGRNFLALSDDTPLIHYLDLPNPPRPLQIDLPLRILVTISAPRDPNLPLLNVEAERKRILASLGWLGDEGRIQLDFTPDASLKSIQRVLRSARSNDRPYHIWHFIGHGGFDLATQNSVLVLCDEYGNSSLVNGFQLGTLFDGFPEIRLVLLNSCEGARTGRSDPFSGVAVALVERRIPAVIGMQFEFSDSAAIAFSEEFYSALVDGLPIDAALTQARRAIFFLPNWVEWATPILFMRSPNGELFNILAESRTPSKPSITREPDTGGPEKPDEEKTRWEQPTVEKATNVEPTPSGSGSAESMVLPKVIASEPVLSETKSLPGNLRSRLPVGLAGVVLVALIVGLTTLFGVLKFPPPNSPGTTSTNSQQTVGSVALELTATLAETLSTGSGILTTRVPGEGSLIITMEAVGSEENGPETTVPTSQFTGSPGATVTFMEAVVEPLPRTSTPASIDSMALIPAGEFQMGQSRYHDPNHKDEEPDHSVYLDAYYIDLIEVANSDYRACMDAKVCGPPASNLSYSRSDYFENPVYDRYPVIFVNWEMAQTYCEWRGARLPTEAEWEKAARGGLERMEYPWGNDDSSCNLANAWLPGEKKGCNSDTTPGGSYPPNGYGLFDMAGNVWEWVWDWYSSDYYQISPGKNPQGPNGGVKRVIRGGSFLDYLAYTSGGSQTNYGVDNLQVNRRSSFSPELSQAKLGFRCALSDTNLPALLTPTGLTNP